VSELTQFTDTAGTKRPLVVYLAGPINGCSDAEAKDWRERVKCSFGAHERVTFLDPMRRDYRGRELEPGIAEEIVAGDLEDIEASDVLLVAVPKPSIGTAMEVFHAHANLAKPVIIWHDSDKPSPWLVVHSARIERTLHGAILAVRDYLS
jgi:nucleoside 2-deoxyribosyltransferase